MHTLRRMSAKLVFIVFRQQTITIQGVLQSFKPNEGQGGKFFFWFFFYLGQSLCESQLMVGGFAEHGTISEQMVRTVEHYPVETIVVAHAKIRKAVQTVKNATVHEYELEVYEVHRVTELTEHVPFTVYDAENINREKDDFDGEGSDSHDDTSPTPSQPMSPVAADTPKDAHKENTRVSSDLARHAFARLANDSTLESRSKLTGSLQSVYVYQMLIANSECGYQAQPRAISTAESTIEQQNC